MYNYFFDDGESLYTDLAIERQKADPRINGITYEKELCLPGYWERVRISSEEGAKAIGRPLGTYDTLNTARLDTMDDDGLYDVQEELARRLCTMFGDIAVMPARILVVGLGNDALTPDSTGPKCAKLVRPTMHIRDWDEELFDGLECSEIAVLAPGVSARTGMDTGAVVKAVCESICPDAVIAIDSIMTSSRERLGSTVQITDTGIFPGGVGNLKTPITRSGVGVPVIGIGVPTVIDSRLLCSALPTDTIDFEPLFISPREIDEITDNASRVISGAINQAFGLLA